MSLAFPVLGLKREAQRAPHHSDVETGRQACATVDDDDLGFFERPPNRNRLENDCAIGETLKSLKWMALCMNACYLDMSINQMSIMAFT
jgi:hypothetical protein